MKKPISISPNPLIFIDEENTRSLGLEVVYTDGSKGYVKLLDSEQIKKIHKEINEKPATITFGIGNIKPLE